MSGQGVMTVRVRRSLLRQLRGSALKRRKTIHEDVREGVAWLDGLDVPHLRALPHPAREPNRVRLSVYLNTEGISRLESAAKRSGLAPSVLLQRLLNVMPDLSWTKRVQRSATQKDAPSSNWKPALVLAATFVLPIVLAAFGAGVPAKLRANSTRPIYE